jgi:hypothetical protein
LPDNFWKGNIYPVHQKPVTFAITALGIQKARNNS